MDIHRILKRLILVLCMALVAIPGFGSWALVQEKAGTGTGNPVSTTAFSSALTNPSLIVVYIYRQSTTANSTPSDTATNSYTDCGSGALTLTSAGWIIECYYAFNTHTTASNVVHEANATGDFVAIAAVEFTGGATSGIVDAYASNANASTGTGGGQNMTSTPASTNVDGDLIIGAGTGTNGTLTQDVSFTIIDTGTIGDNFIYKTQTTHGSVAATWNDNINNETYIALVVAFKLVGGSTAYYATPSESNPTSDTLDTSLACSCGIAETNATSDVLVRSAAFGRSDSESNTTSDAVVRLAGFGRGESETNTASGGLARLAAFDRADSESNTVSDALVRMVVFNRVSSEGYVTLDSVVVIGPPPLYYPINLRAVPH